MRAPAHLRSLTPSAAEPGIDPYIQPQTSFRNKVARALWGVTCALLFRP